MTSLFVSCEGLEMKAVESSSIWDMKEVDPHLEKHRKDIAEKYLEYEIVLLQKARDQGKTFDEVIEQMKTMLWYIKNERMQQMNNEFGL